MTAWRKSAAAGGRAGLLLGLVLGLSRPGLAAPAEPAASEDDGEVNLHAFVSQGFLWSTSNNYLARSERGSFEFTDAALNVSRRFGDRLRMALQLFTRDLGPLGNYRVRFDWFVLDYRLADWLGVRAGHLKVPFGLYNDTSDYDPARVQVLLPQVVYPTTSRDFLLGLTGLEVHGQVPLGAAGELGYRFYGGTSFIDPSDSTSPIMITALDVPYTAGLRLLWEPIEGLRVGGSVLATKLEIKATAAGMPGNLTLPASLWVASAEYVRGGLKLASEYSRWYVDLTSDLPALPSQHTVSERYYALGSYELSERISAGLYYAGEFPNVAQRSGRRDRFRHDLAASLRLDLHAHWLLKLEAHYLIGTADLTPALNDNHPPSTLDKHWGFFLVKTTAYF